MPTGEKTKLLWQNFKYKKMMSDIQKEKKYPHKRKKIKEKKMVLKKKIIKFCCLKPKNKRLKLH